MKPFIQYVSSPVRGALRFSLSLLAAAQVYAAETGMLFATPEAAVAALAAAVKTTNQAEVRTIFGPAAEALVNPDSTQAANDFAMFATALGETNYLQHASDTRKILIIGHNDHPFAVPLVQKGGQWFFDTAAGAQELLARRVGRNELATLDVARAYVQAQREYASRDRDADEVLEYAQKIISSPGAKDGLFWSPDLDGEISPLGPFAANAAVEGYLKKGQDDAGPQPFQGYLFKLLKRQGKSSPGGKYDYVINGNMIGGFALVAWPADYGNSGVMTFIVNQQGRVYQRDLGPQTAKKAQAMQEYDRDKNWSESPD